MQRVFVLDKQNRPLMPCHPARSRELLDQGRAAVYRRVPFTIILKDRTDGQVQPLRLKLDPGSKTTGMALVAPRKGVEAVLWAGELKHRGAAIRAGLDARRALRRGRRNRKTHYRAVRFLNRTKPQGWLAPSLQHCVDTTLAWVNRLARLAPVTAISQELVRFDMQLIQNPEIAGVEYQQGELAGYEVREYLLEKWGRCCAYCGASDVPLEVEHVLARANGGTHRISNLTLSCRKCNERKGTIFIETFLAQDPARLARIKAQARAPLKDAAAVNSTRWALYAALNNTGLPVEVGTGGRTKWNRIQQSLPKAHWIDAACVGESGEIVRIPTTLRPLIITAMGRGTRQVVRTDRYGFPRTKAGKVKRVQGFSTGDQVRLSQPTGKYAGTWIGRLAGIRADGRFDIKTTLGKVTAYARNFTLLQRNDGYAYA